MSGAPLLALQGLAKRYRRGGQQVQALQELDLQLHAGERVGLLGPNGAGKTTLLKLITRLCAPDAGQLLWEGQPLDRAQLGRIGLLLEGRGALNERLSTWENARYFCALREQRFDAAFCRRLAELLALPDLQAPVRQFSTGNKQRAALLLTLVHRPALLLLDEPTLGLDLFGVERLQALIDTAQQEGAAVLLSSHDLGFIEASSERIVCLAGGRKRFDGPRLDFVPRDGGYRVSLSDPENLLGEGHAPAWQPADATALAALLQRLQAALPRLQSLCVQPLTLAERYRELIEESTP
jgi:ABC-2 type transport system ATP-binding protein